MTRPMRLYPVFLNLKGRRVLIVGGGPGAARKAKGLLKAGARVTVVAPAFSPALPKAVRRLRRRYSASDVRGNLLVVAATDDRALNVRIARQARSAGALVNRTDDSGDCDYHVPSVFRKGELAVAVSTGGTSPALARRIRLDLLKRYGGRA